MSVEQGRITAGGEVERRQSKHAPSPYVRSPPGRHSLRQLRPSSFKLQAPTFDIGSSFSALTFASFSIYSNTVSLINSSQPMGSGRLKPLTKRFAPPVYRNNPDEPWTEDAEDERTGE